MTSKGGKAGKPPISPRDGGGGGRKSPWSVPGQKKPTLEDDRYQSKSPVSQNNRQSPYDGDLRKSSYDDPRRKSPHYHDQRRSPYEDSRPAGSSAIDALFANKRDGSPDMMKTMKQPLPTPSMKRGSSPKQRCV